jgi:uncharacterized protein (TIGR03435 family)
MKYKLEAVKIVLFGAGAIVLSSLSFAFAGPQDTPAQTLSFEVASIKPSEGDGRMVRIQTSPGGRYTASGVNLKMLIQQAYDIKDFQIVGGPAWMSSTPFDIVAKAEDPNVTGAQIRLMLRSLLAERFQLKFHRETRELPVYTLVVGKNGHKLQLSATQPNPDGAPPSAPKPGALPAGAVGGGVGLGTGAGGGTGVAPKASGSMMSIGPGQINAQMAPVSALVNMLAQQLGRPVIDKTDLKGSYDFKLEWTPDATARKGIGAGAGGEAPPAGDSSGPSIFTAVQEQLGLRLESQKGPVEVLVIDAVEKPSGN